MAIAIDGSSPAIVTTTADPVTTASFSPPASTVLVACVFVENSTDQAITMSNTGTALTWTQHVIRTTAEAGSNSGEIAIFTAPNTAGQAGITVTATVATVSSYAAIKVYVLTGASLSSPVGATGEGNSATNAITPTAYTSTVLNSRGICAAHDWLAPGAPSSTDDEETFHTASQLSGMAVTKSANTTPTGTAVTFNLDSAGTAAARWIWVAVEILPSVTLPLRNTFNGGTDGTTITPANSGGASGDTFGSANGTPKFESDNVSGLRSPMACLFTTSTTDVVRWTGITLAAREIWLREYIYFTGNPSSSDFFIGINNLGAATNNLLVYVDTNGKIAVNDAANNQVGLTTASITLNSWVRLEVYCLTGTTTANGAFEVRLFNTTESMTPTETISGSGLNFTTTVPDRISWAYHSGVASYQADDFEASDTGWIGPATLAPPPIRNRAYRTLLVR